MTTQQYSTPVAQLLHLGNPTPLKESKTYLELGITSQHIPELAQMAIDPDLLESEEDFHYWAAIHAWRVLGMIQSNDAIAPLIRILQTLSRDEELWDWVGEDLPHYLAYLGAPALPELSKLLADVSQTDYARENAITAITGIYKRYPETRTDCINALTKQLAHFTKNNPDLNARLVTDLTTDFKATETVELIEQAFQSGRVNEDFIGDWNDAQVYLGLMDQSDLPKKPSRNIILDPWKFVAPEPIGFSPSRGTNTTSTGKLQPQSRKKNRKKK